MIFLSLFALLLNFSIAKPQTISDKIQHEIEAVINKQKLVGTQAAIWHKGDIIYTNNWGKANIAMNVHVSSDSKFFIASITKSITGLIIMKLHNENKIDLDVPIQIYIPEFPKKSETNITVRMLLQNQSGIRHYFRGETSNGSFFDAHYNTSVDAIEKFKNDDLLFKPGTRTQYTSFGYTLLAAIIEKVTKQNFSEYLKTTLFNPLKMKNTEAPDWRYPVINLATSYAFFLPHLGLTEERPFEARRLNFSYNSGGGNIVSTAEDLVKYGHLFLQNTNYLSEILNAKGRSYNYGWNITQDDNNRTIINSTGASEAYQGSITIWPNDELIIVALSNTWGIGSRDAGFTINLHKQIAKHILKD